MVPLCLVTPAVAHLHLCMLQNQGHIGRRYQHRPVHYVTRDLETPAPPLERNQMHWKGFLHCYCSGDEPLLCLLSQLVIAPMDMALCRAPPPAPPSLILCGTEHSQCQGWVPTPTRECIGDLTSHAVATSCKSSLVCSQHLPIAVKHEGMHWGTVMHSCDPQLLHVLHKLDDMQLSSLNFVKCALIFDGL